ncbi:MAG: hypothetical protein AAGA48_28070 [Myxococcota bacterium]
MIRFVAMMCVLAAWTACAGRDWRRAQSLNTGEAYRSFVSANPGSSKVPLAMERAERLDWIFAKATDTPGAYGSYLGAHPTGPHAAEARERAEALALAEAEAVGTPEALLAFLVQYPSSERKAKVERRIEEAWHRLAVTEGTEDAWGRYLVRYPEGRWAEDARQAREEAAWARAVEGDTPTAYQRYLDRFADGRYRLDALDWMARLRVTRIQPVVTLGEAPVEFADRAALTYAVRKEIDQTLNVELRRDFQVLRTLMVDLRGGPSPHPQDAYGNNPNTGIVVVNYSEKLGARLEPSGSATDISATVQLYCPPSRKPVLETTITASTPLPAVGETEAILHQSALEAFGDQLRAVADDIATVRPERR